MNNGNMKKILSLLENWNNALKSLDPDESHLYTMKCNFTSTISNNVRHNMTSKIICSFYHKEPRGEINETNIRILEK